MKKPNNYKDFPATLILQRKSITMFPNSQRVGLYYCEKLKKYFTVLQEGSQNLQAEECVNILENIDEEVVELVFNDDSSLNINKECSQNILNYLNSINTEEKDIIQNYMLESSDNFLEVLQTSVNQKDT